MKPRISRESVEGVEAMIDKLRADNEAFYAHYPGEPRLVIEEQYDEMRWALLKTLAMMSTTRAGE